MIDVEKLRKDKAHHWGGSVFIDEKDLPELDLSNIRIGDWIGGLGDMKDFAIVGFLNFLGQNGFSIVKRQQ